MTPNQERMLKKLAQILEVEEDESTEIEDMLEDLQRCSPLTLRQLAKVAAKLAVSSIQRGRKEGLALYVDVLGNPDVQTEVKAKPEPAQLPSRSFKLEEVDSLYCGKQDRYIVSLIAGYSEVDARDHKEAAKNLMTLVEDGKTDGGTGWYVFDRKTKTMHGMVQRNFQDYDYDFEHRNEEVSRDG